jgi:hypothetical protein
VGFLRCKKEVSFDERAAPPSTTQSSAPRNPQLASGLPVDKLRTLFIFTSGDGHKVMDSPVVVGFVNDTVGVPLSGLMGTVFVDVIANSDAGARTVSMETFWEAAGPAMENIRPAETNKARAGEYRTVIRPFPDPTSGDHVMVVLLYEQALEPPKVTKPPGFDIESEKKRVHDKSMQAKERRGPLP